MDPDSDLGAAAQRNEEYRKLPRTVRLEDTIASIAATPAPDPDAVRNFDQHRALRDD